MPLTASTAVGLALTIAAGAVGANPGRLTLRLGDLPVGFAPTSAKVVSLAAAAKEGPQSVADYRRWGYVTGYEADFALKGQIGSGVRGAVLIVSSASVYETQRGAAASWTASVQACARTRQTCARLSFSPKIGDRAALLKATTKSGGATLVTLAVVWQRGPMKAAVLAAGVGAGPSVASVAALAAKQDRRMASVR